MAFWGTRLWKTHYSKSETSHRERTSRFACSSRSKRFSTVEKMCVHVVMGWEGWTWRRWNRYVNKRLVAIELSFANVPLCTENHRIVSSFPLSVHESPCTSPAEKLQIALLEFISGFFYPYCSGMATCTDIFTHYAVKKGKIKPQNFKFSKQRNMNPLTNIHCLPWDRVKIHNSLFLLTLQILPYPSQLRPIYFCRNGLHRLQKWFARVIPFLWTLRPSEFDPDQADHKPFCLDNRGNGTVSFE